MNHVPVRQYHIIMFSYLWQFTDFTLLAQNIFQNKSLIKACRHQLRFNGEPSALGGSTVPDKKLDCFALLTEKFGSDKTV